MRLSEKDDDILMEIITEGIELKTEENELGIMPIFEKIETEKIVKGIIAWFLNEAKEIIEK